MTVKISEQQASSIIAAAAKSGAKVSVSTTNKGTGATATVTGIQMSREMSKIEGLKVAYKAQLKALEKAIQRVVSTRESYYKMETQAKKDAYAQARADLKAAQAETRARRSAWVTARDNA